MGLAIIISLIVIVLDQLSKYWILNNLALYESIPIIKDFFSLFHIRNSGAAWGILSDQSWGIYILTIISISASIFIFYLIYINDIKPVRITLALILGGSIGNLIDRIRFNNVVDFLSFTFGDYQFPTFNVADSAIVVGAICLTLYLIFKPEKLKNIKLTNKTSTSSVVKSGFESEDSFTEFKQSYEIEAELDSVTAMNNKINSIDKVSETKTKDE